MNAPAWKTSACPYDCPDGCAMRGRFDGNAVTLEPNPAPFPIPPSSAKRGCGGRPGQ